MYIEPTWKYHMGYHVKDLIPFPPKGYEFITQEGTAENVANSLSKYPISFQATELLGTRLPLYIMKSRLDKLIRKRPKEADLTLALNHLVFREEPWVVEVGRIWELVALNTKLFKKYMPLVERSFASDYCKGVLFFTEFSKQTCLSVMNCSGFEHKLGVFPRAERAKKFSKEYGGNVKILFVGSANLAGQFELRGGKELLEAFDILVTNYKNIELIIRSDMPPPVKKKYQRILSSPNVTVIEGFMPWQEVEQLYKSSDIFLFPCHYESWQIILEAMSYELAVVALDVEGVSEFVEDGKTGFLVPESEFVPRFDGKLPLPTVAPQVLKALKTTDPKLVQNLVDKVSILIENTKLRREMAAAGRWQVEQGKCSIEYRNKKLKEVFDQATS